MFVVNSSTLRVRSSCRASFMRTVVRFLCCFIGYPSIINSPTLMIRPFASSLLQRLPHCYGRGWLRHLWFLPCQFARCRLGCWVQSIKPFQQLNLLPLFTFSFRASKSNVHQPNMISLYGVSVCTVLNLPPPFAGFTLGTSDSTSQWTPLPLTNSFC